MNTSLEFFSRQFARQIAAADYALNPFEQAVLPHLQGRVLDLGCGLGSLSIAAAERGHAVTAFDACPHAVANLQRRARARSLPIEAFAADLSEWRADAEYDAVVAIGLLMFFSCEKAVRVLGEIRRAVAAGGVVAVNVLIEGTTYMKMFDPQNHCLFKPDQLRQAFAGWTVLMDEVEEFPAESGEIKRFCTVIARRPATIQKRQIPGPVPCERSGA